ncbi:MAG TPA: hypothetical protein VLA19_20975 [Herpetosiphonaceae bacterium]|nr:hypothetical protein [Herpetosiphonaceae bacterium]
MLIGALQALGLEGEITLAGRSVTLQSERCAVYIVESRRDGYYTWCDDPWARTVEFYLDPTAAIQAGMRRAMRPETEGTAG